MKQEDLQKYYALVTNKTALMNIQVLLKEILFEKDRHILPSDSIHLSVVRQVHILLERTFKELKEFDDKHTEKPENWEPDPEDFITIERRE